MPKLLDLLSGGLIKDVGGVIDNLHTSDEEKAKAKLEMKKLLVSAEQKAQEAVSSRWESDLKYGSWLARNIRPLTLVFLTSVFVLISFFDGNLGQFAIGDGYVPVYQTLLMTVYGAYFAGRSIEKIKKSS